MELHREVERQKVARRDLIVDAPKVDPAPLDERHLPHQGRVRDGAAGHEVDAGGQPGEIVLDLETARRDDTDLENGPFLPGLVRLERR